MTCASAPGSTSAPTAITRSPRITTVPRSMTGPSPGTIRAPLIAMVGCAREAAVTIRRANARRTVGLDRFMVKVRSQLIEVADVTDDTAAVIGRLDGPLLADIRYDGVEARFLRVG